MRYCPNCKLRVEAAVNFCPKCWRPLLRAVSHRQRSADNTRSSQKLHSSTRPRESGGVAEAVFGWLGRRLNKKQVFVVLVSGLLLMLAVAFSAMHRGGEEYKGEPRTKSLVYGSDGGSRMGLYWMDDEGNLHKATAEEINRCEKLHPEERIPVCRTKYFEKDEDKQ